MTGSESHLSEKRIQNGRRSAAEEQGHHPHMHLTWGSVRIEIWTHKINGLTESDFVFAAKADEALKWT